jgi:outer membrane lipoprotein-sorting protein
MKPGLFLSVFLFVLNAAAAAKSTALHKVLEKYSKAKSIQTSIKKTEDKPTAMAPTVLNGEMKVQKNKIYITLNGDAKTEFFYVNKSLILVEYPDADFAKAGAKRKVTTLKKSVPPFVGSLLGLFTDPKTFKKEFSLVSETAEDGALRIKLEPKNEKMKSLSVLIDPKKYTVSQLSFVDDVNNSTTIEFSNTKLNGKLGKSDFQFVKQSTDEELSE